MTYGCSMAVGTLVVLEHTSASLTKNWTAEAVRMILSATHPVPAATPLSSRDPVDTDAARVTQNKFVSAASTSKYTPSAGGSPVVAFPSPARKSNVPTACPNLMCHVSSNRWEGLIVPTEDSPRGYREAAVLMVLPVSRRTIPVDYLCHDTRRRSIYDGPAHSPTMPVVYPPAMNSSRRQTDVR